MYDWGKRHEGTLLVLAMVLSAIGFFGTILSLVWV